MKQEDYEKEMIYVAMEIAEYDLEHGIKHEPNSDVKKKMQELYDTVLSLEFNLGKWAEEIYYQQMHGFPRWPKIKYK